MTDTLPGEVRDTSVLRAEDVELQTEDGTIGAYLARPVAPGPRPGVVVIHEAFGLVEHVRDVARRFANVGFDAIAPDLYAREGPPDPGDMGSVAAKMFAIPDARALYDLGAAARHLRGLDDATGKVGCVGFCAGGRHSLLLATAGPVVDAAVDCWGGFIERATPDHELTQDRPATVIDLLEGVSCPVLLVGGAEDEMPSPAVIHQAEERLRDLGRDVRVEIFADAGHAFFADYRPSYRPAAAFRLWDLLVDFFRARLS
jgi:carboxymethylenebutenolidase